MIPASWPLVILEQGDNLSYLMGDEPIIDDLERILSEKGFNQANEISWRDRISLYLEKKFVGNLNQDTGQLSFFGWGILIVAGLIDSINPCAIGVLIFLMISLLKMGSNRRALKAGLIYPLVVFIVYFLAGFGIFKIIQQFTGITRSIYLVAGILVLMLGLWQFKDIIFPKFGPSLQISPSAKPIIEKIIYKGTIPAMIVLGIIVSIFELPCTGGVYIAIIAILAKFQVSPILYLFVYNLVFILPMIGVTLAIYFSFTTVDKVSGWKDRNIKILHLIEGLILVILGILMFTGVIA